MGTLGGTFRSSITFLATTSLFFSGLLPSFSSIVTDPTPDQAGSTTALRIAGEPIREGAVLQTGATATVGTSALLNPGLGDREIRTSYDAETVYQAGSVQAPEGWTLQYSTDGGANWLNSEPSPASGVTDIRATRTSVAAGAIDGYSQEYSTETVSSIPSSTFSASTGGDGWGVDFYENYVINIYHHADLTVFECKLKTTGQLCQTGVTNYTIQSPVGANYYASNRSDMAVDQEAGVAYVITGQSNETADANDAPRYTTGVLCIDLKNLPPSWCGFTPLGAPGAGPTGYTGYGDMVKIGTKYFATVGNSSVTPVLYCFDASTQQNCTGSPYSLTGSGFSASPPRIKLSGQLLFVKTSSKLTCLQASNPTLNCAGDPWTAGISVLNSDTDLAIHTDSNGNEDGVCVVGSTGCFDFSGAAQTTWKNPWVELGISGGYPQYSRGITVLGRYYITNFNTQTVYCYDFTTSAACKDYSGANNFVGLTTSNWYMVEVDPENPACLWVNSDGRKMANFDAWSGSAGCASNPVITLQPSQFAPRYACSTSNGIDQWRTLRISNLIGGGSASSINLTVRDGQGATVSGWTNVPVTLNQALDMTSLNVLNSSSRPTFSFAFANVSGSITSATISLEYKGKGPELCSTVVMATPAEAVDITVNGYLIDSVSPAGTYQSQRNFSIDPAAQASSAFQTVPNEPTGLTGSGLNTTATLTFAPPTDNGGLELTGYQYSLDNGATWTPMSGDVDNGNGTRSFTLTGLTAGTTYQMKVAATNVLGRGTASSALSLTAQLVDLDSLSDSYLSVGTINLVTQNQNSLPFTYVADPASVCSVSGTTLTLVAIGTCSITQDQAGDANNLATSVSKSFEVLADPIVTTVPDAPLNLSATPASGQVTLSWTTPSIDGGAPVVDFIVQYKVGTSWIPFNDGLNTLTNVVVTGLTNGTSYDFKVAAVNSVGQGAFTSSVAGTPATIANAATNLSGVKSNLSSTASLSWTAPLSDGGSAITDYRISYKLTSEPTWTVFIDAVSNSASATITGLDSNLDYDYQVEVVNAAGFSAPVSTVTLQATNGNGQVNLTWVAPNTGGATILNYIVEYRLATTSSWSQYDLASTSTSASLGSLINGNAYDVRVAVMVDDGSGGQVLSSYTSTIRANPFSVGEAPVLAVTPGVSQLTLAWATPNANGSSITDYVIEYKLASDSTWTTLVDGVSSLTTAVITNLSNGADYEVRAKSVNLAGQSAFGATVTGTPRTVPGAVTGLSLTAGPASLELAWVAPLSNGGAAITDYQIQYKLLTATSWSVLSRSASTETSVTVPNLQGLTGYSVRVAAVNPAGVGPFGPAGSEVTLVAASNPSPPVPSVTTPAAEVELKIDVKPVAPGSTSLSNAVSVQAGGDLEITGANLGLVSKIMVGEEEAKFETSPQSLRIILPSKLSLMAYETKIMSSDGSVTAGPIVDVTEVRGEIAGKQALLRRLPSGEIKVWVFDPLVAGKIQYLLKDKEIAWIRPEMEGIENRLRTHSESGTKYLVRTLRIPEGEMGEFELKLNGRVIEKYDIEGR